MAAVKYADKQLKELYNGKTENLHSAAFRAARRDFSPEENGLKSSGLKNQCPFGMQFIKDQCGKSGLFLINCIADPRS